MGIEPIYNSSAETVIRDDLGKINVNWKAFKKFIQEANYRGCYGSNIFSCALEYGHCLLDRDLSEIKGLSKCKQATVVKSLSALAKFLGCYEEYLKLIKNYGLSWTGRSADDLIIDRLNKTKDPENIFQWIKDVKEACPMYSVFMDYLSTTGLRLSECIHSYNLIVELTKEGTLAEKYYNVKTGLLEHFRFKEIFIRKCKKAFLSYVPLELLELIGKQEPINENHLKSRALERKHIPQRFCDVRENHASFTTEWLRPEEIDLFHGRVSGSVFKVHYYNPNIVADLRLRAAQAVQAILLKVNSDLVMKKEQNKGGEKP